MNMTPSFSPSSFGGRITSGTQGLDLLDDDDEDEEEDGDEREGSVMLEKVLALC